MTLAVIDASVLVAFYSAHDPRRERVVSRLAVSDSLLAPAHLDAEVVAALRNLASRIARLERVVPDALRHLATFPIRRMSLVPLLERMWQLRANVTPYDAAYVALAEALDAPVVTCDGRLAAASGPRCAFDVLA